MKKQRLSGTEAVIKRFVANHNNGDIAGKLMSLSPSLSVEELHFVRSLISKDIFDQRMKERSEAMDIIIDEKTAKKSLSDALPLLNKYAERKTGLSRESISVVTVHICAELVGRISTECGYDARKKYLSLLPEEHSGMRNLMTVLKKLVSRNRFELGSFNIKYFQIKNIPLEIVWHFHNSDLIPFTNYVYKIARHQDRIEYVKCSLVELLYELCISHKKEHFSKKEITETNVQSPPPPEAAAVDTVGGEFIGLLEIRKTMVKDLLSSLLCATHNISSDSEMLKSSGQVCEEILDAVISEAVTLIVRRLLSATPEVIELSKCINHVAVLLPVVTVSMDVLRSFLTSHLVAILKLKPTVDAHTAITKQNEWTYSRTSPQLLCLLESVLVGLEEYSLTVLKDILQKTEVNWKLTLHVVSSYMRCFPEAGKDMKSVIDWILSKAFLNKSHNLLIAAFLSSRQCCLEGCSSLFSSYLMWFGVTFGPDSPWACRNPAIIENYEFLLEVLTEMVPYEPASCLKVHINRAPTGPQNTHGLLVNYLTLAKTRLKDLNEVPGFGIFGPEFTTVEDIDHALKYFESHGEQFPQTLLNATLFRRQHFEQEFLVKLLAPRLIPNVPDTKSKFIRKLHTMGKIPPIVYNKYLEECERQKREIEDIMFVDSPEIIEEPSDPEVEFSKSLCDFSDTMKTLNHLWDTQLLEGDETTDLPPPIRDAVKKLAFSVNRFIGPEQQSVMRTVSSDEIISHHTETLEKVVEGLLNTFFGCCPPRCHIFVQHFVEIFKVSHILITVFLHKLTKYWSGEDSLSDDEMKNVAALVYSIEFHGNNVFPKVKYRNKELTFITFLSEHTPLQTAQQMNKFYRLAVEYMNIAESYYKISKEASDEEALRCVPLPFAKKVYYLHSRYSYAEINQACQSNVLQLRIFTSLLPISQMSLKEWFYQEATVTPFEDFLVSRYEYLFNRLTCRPSFDAKNIMSLASEVLDTVYTLSMDNNLTTERSWTSFLRDILQVLSSIMETFPLPSINHSHSWLLKVWLRLHETSNSAFSTIKFFRIVSNLPAWLLYSNSRTQLPSHAAVKMVVNFVNSHLKDVLCDENGFLHLSLLQFLLVGISMSSCYDYTAASQLFSLLFDSCPAVMLASQVHTSVVLSIIKRFELSKDSAFNKILMRLKREGSELQHFEIALEDWLHRRSTSGLHSLVCKWVFFFNVLRLGTLLHFGVVKVNYESDTISLCYSREEINSSNLISLLNAELDRNVEVIDTLDLIALRQYLPFSGLSELSQSLISVASLLLLLQYVMLKTMDTHMYFSSNALLMCKVTLSCFSYWIKSGVSQQTISTISKNQERNSPLLDSKLLETVRSHLYSLLNTLAIQKSVSVPNEYIEGPGDAVIESIFQR